MNEWFIASSENFKSAPKMDSSGRHKFCHSLISSSTVNQSFVFTTAFSTSPFFSLALGLRRGRCRSAPSPSLLFLFLFLLSRSVTSVGLLRLLLVAFLGRLDIFCQNLDLVGDGGLEARSQYIFEWFLAKYSIWLCSGFSVAQNGHFLRRGASTI